MMLSIRFQALTTVTVF